MLDSVTRILLQPNKKEITTYKIIQRYKDKSLFSNHLNLNLGTSKRHFFKFAPIGEWTSCYIDHDGYEWSDKNLKTKDSGEDYPTGFHCFLDLDDAKKTMEYYKNSNIHILCKCISKYRMIFGLQKFWIFGDSIVAKIVVCRGIKIIEIL